MTQPSLFDNDDFADSVKTMVQAHARHTDPPESHAAAASVDVTRNQAAVLATLRRRGPCTDAALVTFYEAEHAVHWEGGHPPQSPSGIRTRRRELVEAGRVRDSGARVRLDSGRWAAVWEVTP